MAGTFDVQTAGASSYGPLDDSIDQRLRIITATSDVFYELVFYRGREPAVILLL